MGGCLGGCARPWLWGKSAPVRSDRALSGLHTHRCRSMGCGTAASRAYTSDSICKDSVATDARFGYCDPEVCHTGVDDRFCPCLMQRAGEGYPIRQTQETSRGGLCGQLLQEGSRVHSAASSLLSAGI